MAAQTQWTLVCGGVEKSLGNKRLLDTTGVYLGALASWGVCVDFERTWQDRAKATVRLRTIEGFDAAAGQQWAFKARAQIYRDRVPTLDGGGAPTGAYTGGTLWFDGFFDAPRMTTQGGRQNVEYRLHDVLWFFERNSFAQHRNQFAGWDPTHFRITTAGLASTDASAGYQAGDVLTVNGGAGTSATVLVTTVNGSGGITGVQILTQGSYTAAPTNTTANLATGGHGTGVQLYLGTGEGITYTDIVLPEVYLGENANGTQLTIGGQVQEVINWVNECYNPTKRGASSGRDNSQDVVASGTIDPATAMWITRMNTVSCSEAIVAALRTCPDAMAFVTPASPLPVFNVRRLGKWNNGTVPPTFVDYTNLPEVTINITADQESRILLENQVARTLPGVKIYYLTSSDVDGQVQPVVVTDKFPSTISDFTPEVSRHFVDLAGYKLIRTRAFVDVLTVARVDLPIVNYPGSDQVNWWVAHDRTLQDPLIDGGSISVQGQAIVDESGNPITLAYFPNELRGHLPKWAGYNVVNAIVSGIVGFSKYADAAHTQLSNVVTARVVRHKIKLTNAPGGWVTGVSEFDSGDAIPQGVAESLYRSAAAQQWAGEITFAKGQLRSDIYLGCRLKLVGPTTTFSNVLPRSISEQPHFGRTTVSVGPCAPMDIDFFLEITRATKLRTTYRMPSGRATGDAAGGEQIDMGGDTPVDNTSHGVGGDQSHFVTKTVPI